ncbi:MAG: DoxX family membrane protein [Patescibacteria group bacterium]|nr:DoxX family membrane protein [Patescibacteria group bacterium]MCL5257842.1 DoxX family membrane protein [Patescibacteria group bacterium]
MNKYLNYNFLIRAGLGLIFIANALTAFFAPADFIEIIKSSFVANILPFNPAIFAHIIIGLNDSIVGLLLIVGIATRRVAVWATIWLIGVMIVIGNPLEIMEHSGLLLLSATLVLGDQYLNKNDGSESTKY